MRKIIWYTLGSIDGVVTGPLLGMFFRARYGPPHRCWTSNRDPAGHLLRCTARMHVASPYWGSIPELLELTELAPTGKIRLLVDHFRLEHVSEAYRQLHDGKIRGRVDIAPNG